jgi:MAP/microtubule affinity-regulating kinase
LFRKILSGAYTVPEFVSPECCDLVRRMLVGDPAQRATLEEALRHSWLQMGHTPASSEELADVAFSFSFSMSHEVDPAVVEQMETLGFPREQALDSIVNNRYDIAASTYYLLASRKFKSQPAPPVRPLGVAVPVAPPQPQPPQPQRPSRGIRGHKRHHTVDVPIAEMENQAHSAAHQDPLRDPAPQMNKSRHPQQPLQPVAPQRSVPHQPSSPTPTITLTPTPQHVEEPQPPAATAGVRIPDPAHGNGNPGLLPFWRQRGHHRSRSVDTTSSGMQSPPQHDYTSHIIKEATILNSSPTGSRIARRSPPLNKAHVPPGHHSPPIPPDIARVKAAARRKSMRPRSVGPWNPPAEAATIPAACDVPPPPHEDQSLESQLRASATVQLPQPPPAQEQGPFKPGHRRAQSYDVRALKAQEQPVAGAQWHPAQDEEDPLSDDDPNKRGDQSKGALNSLVNSLKSGLGLLRGRGEKEKEPRSIRFALNVSTTSAKSAEEIMNEVSRVLALNNTTFTTSSYCAYCTCDDVHFEVEVCKLPMLSMNGIRFNRISGDAWTYKRIAAKLIEQMEL